MKWAVVGGCLFLAVVLGVIGLGQELELEWETNLHVLPDLVMDYTEFELTYSFSDWQLMTNLKYYTQTPSTTVYFMDLSFQVDGVVGPLDVDGGLVFDPLLGQGYEASYLEVKTSPWLNLDLAFKAQHYADKLCNSQTGPYVLYSFRSSYKFTRTMSLSTQLRFDECNCGSMGTTWKDFSIAVNNIGPFCYGLYDVKLITNCDSGFESITVSGDKLYLFDSDLVTFDFDLKFSVDEKSLTVKPKLKSPYALGCLTVYQAIISDPDNPMSMTGYAFYGLKASVALGECTKVEYATALTPGKVPGSFKNDEFEYFKAQFCAPGCCGKKLKGTFSAFFKPNTAPIGLSRVVATAEIPISPSFSLKIMFESPGTFDIGWKLEFL